MRSLHAEEKPVEGSTSKLYTLINSPHSGRSLIAATDIPSGTLVIKESALVVGPQACSALVCIGCHKPIEEECLQCCALCGWPICSEACPSLLQHAPECQIFQKDLKKCGIPAQWGTTPRYDLVLIARCLVLRATDPTKWQALHQLQSHKDDRKNEQEPHHMAAIRYFSQVCKLDFSDDQLHRIRGIIITNSINTQSPQGATVRGIYPNISMLNHCCYPNLTLRSDSDHNLYIYSAVDIRKGDPLHFSYVPVSCPIWQRKIDLWAVYRFDCSCVRCTDPTEMRSNFSALRCDCCYSGFLQFNRGWNQECSCSNCSRHISFAEVTNKCEQLADTYLHTDALNVQQINTLLADLLSETHRNHFLYLKLLQQCQSALTSSDAGSLEVKIALWKEANRFLDIIEPGKTRRKGLTLLHLASSIFKLVTHNESSEPKQFVNHQQKLTESLAYLDKSLDILHLEPPNSTEQKWVLAATNLKKDLVLKLTHYNTHDTIF